MSQHDETKRHVARTGPIVRTVFPQSSETGFKGPVSLA